MTKRYGALVLSVLVLVAAARADDEAVPQARGSFYGSTKNLKCPLPIEPNKSFGPLSLGMNEEAVRKTRLVVKRVTGSSFRLVGMFVVNFDQKGEVFLIEAELGDLPDCVRYGKTKVPKNATPEALAKIFDGCGETQAMIGGNTISCRGVDITWGGWGGKQKTPSLKLLRPAAGE